MDPITISALIGGFMGLGKTGFGIGQLLTAKKPERQTYRVPEEMTNYVDMARAWANQSLMPGQARMEDTARKGFSTGFSRAKEAGSGSDIIGAINQLFGGEQDVLNQIGIQSAQYRRGSQEQYGEALQRMAEYRDKAWELNKNRPYYEDLYRYYDKRDSGVMNMFGGLQDIYSSGMNLADAQYTRDFMKYLQDNDIGDSSESDNTPGPLRDFPLFGSNPPIPTRNFPPYRPFGPNKGWGGVSGLY